MKLLIVSATNQRRGAETEAYELSARLREAGIDVDHVALSDTGLDGSRLDIEPLGTSWRSPSTLRGLRRRAKSADLVLAFGSKALPACAVGLFGSRISFIYRSIGDPTYWVRGPIHRWRTGVLIRRAKHVVALWDGAADAIATLYRFPRARISVIPNARSAEDFPPVTTDARQHARRVLGYSPDDRVVAVIGSLSREKCVDRAIEAITCDDSLKLIIAGDGPLRMELLSLADDRAPGRVTFLGNVERIQDVYAAADVVLITSSTEGLPGVAIEAGLSGIAVVATDVGGVASVVRDEVTGILIRDSNRTISDSLRNALRIRQDLGSNAHAVCMRRFEWQLISQQWVDSFKRDLARGSVRYRPR